MGLFCVNIWQGCNIKCGVGWFKLFLVLSMQIMLELKKVIDLCDCCDRRNGGLMFGLVMMNYKLCFSGLCGMIRVSFVVFCCNWM